MPRVGASACYGRRYSLSRAGRKKSVLRHGLASGRSLGTVERRHRQPADGHSGAPRFSSRPPHPDGLFGRGRVSAALLAACTAARLCPHPLLRSARSSASLGGAGKVSPTARRCFDPPSRDAQRRTATGRRAALPSLPLWLAANRRMALGRGVASPSTRSASPGSLRLLMKPTNSFLSCDVTPRRLIHVARELVLRVPRLRAGLSPLGRTSQ